MYRRLLVIIFCALTVVFVTPAIAASSAINLSATNILGTLNLDAKELKSIKDAIEKTLKNDNIDAVVECGEVRMDCEVRTARKWDYNGDHFREVVVYVHTVGNSSITLRNHDGKWPDINIK
jgi:hypothetical protein